LKCNPTPTTATPLSFIGSITFNIWKSNLVWLIAISHFKKQRKNRMVEEPSHVKQLSLSQVCKIGSGSTLVEKL
jgi:hypothetical protein